MKRFLIRRILIYIYDSGFFFFQLLQPLGKKRLNKTDVLKYVPAAVSKKKKNIDLFFLSREQRDISYADIPCGTKFLREFNFADGRYFCVLRDLIFAIGKDRFFLLEINFFAISVT